MNSSFLYLLGDCINIIACVRNTKVIQLSYILKVNKLRNTVPSAVIPIAAKSTDKCKNKQSFWSTLLLMIQTFVFVRNLGSFSSAPSPSFEVRPSFAVMRQRSEALLRKCNCSQPQAWPQRARVTRASSGFRFFAFTSPLLGRISLKKSILRVKVSPFTENRLSFSCSAT